MKNTIVIYKEIGETPLEAVEKFRIKNPKYKNIKLGYAGRLDPMAEGLLLILVGDENKKRKNYERLKKVYEFEVLFGASTDTYDMMGKVTEIKKVDKLDVDKLEKLIKTYVGESTQSYPPFSSPRVKGKPLFYWAREERLNEITIPKKQIKITSLKVKGLSQIDSQDLLSEIEENLGKVSGVFRQKEIISLWRKKLTGVRKFYIVKFEIECSSGTYVRSIANTLGIDLAIGAIAYKIKRVSIGNFNVIGV